MVDAGQDLALEVSDLRVGYGGAMVLQGVSLKVPAGNAVAVLGPNGAGKTTLMRTVAGFKKPESGEVRLKGADVSRLTPVGRTRRGLCDIPDGRGIFPSLSVRENLRLFAMRGQQRRTVNEATDTFPALAKHINQRAGSMSGGQQQMLSLARAYFTEPEVILIDEVSLGLAPVALDQVFAMLVALRERGAALLVVEQYVKRALLLADFVYVVNKGRVVFEGTSAEAAKLDLQEHYLQAGGGDAEGDDSQPPAHKIAGAR